MAAAALAVLPSRAPGQAPGSRPRREIPGFDFHRDGVWRKRARQVAARRAGMLARGQFGALNAPLAARMAVPSAAAVAGIFPVPAILFKYADTPGPILRDTAEYNAVLFAPTPPLGRPYTYRSYYQQLSNGLLDIQGRTYGYAALDSNEVTYTGTPPCTGNPYSGSTNCNGLFDFSSGQALPDPVHRMQMALTEALQKLDASIDWAQYDSDADGYVDLVVFLPPALDGACGGASNNHLWAHRFFLYTAFTTHSPAPGGGFEKVRDYILQSGVGGATACDSTSIMPIGTVAHETGHGFGLPDLYDTNPFESSEGIGEWGLMGSGNYTSALSPSRMEAWSLNELGWVTIAPLGAASTYSFGAAPVSDTAFYIRVPGTNPRGEYFLIENRQASQSDSAMIRIHCTRSGASPSCPGGVLVWHVDSAQVVDGNANNEINTGAIHGLALVQADGRGDLDAGTNRGDGGDPYPGITGVAALSAANNVDGRFAGFMIDLIQQVVPGGAMSFRLLFGTPALSTQAVVAHLLTGSGLTAAEISYLDVNGNRNSQFDLGDFLAWVNATGAP